MEKPKLALLLFGMSVNLEYRHWRIKKHIDVHWRNSYENYKEFIFDFFEKKGYDIDVYFTTNTLNDKDKIELCKAYKPVKCDFIDNYPDKTISRNTKIKNVAELCLSTNMNYDLVLITRFDLLFQKKFHESNIQFDKFNLVSILERPHLICDNFYLFPYKYLKDFSNMVNGNQFKMFHEIKTDIENINGKDFVNYILNNYTNVEHLSFYKIQRKTLAGS